MSRAGSSGAPKTYRLVLRDALPLVAFWLIAALGVVFIVDAALRRGVGGALTTAAIVAGPLAVLWIVLAHPHVRWDPWNVVVTNIGRVHVLPWRRIVSIRQNRGLAFELSDGCVVTADSVSAPRDRGIIASALSKGRVGLGTVEMHRNADALRAYQETQAIMSPGADGRSDVAESRWDVVPLAVAGALLVLSGLVALAGSFPGF